MSKLRGQQMKAGPGVEYKSKRRNNGGQQKSDYKKRWEVVIKQ